MDRKLYLVYRFLVVPELVREGGILHPGQGELQPGSAMQPQLAVQMSEMPAKWRPGSQNMAATPRQNLERTARASMARRALFPPRLRRQRRGNPFSTHFH